MTGLQSQSAKVQLVVLVLPQEEPLELKASRWLSMSRYPTILNETRDQF